MVAFSASRLVCSAMEVMTLMMSPISALAAPSSPTTWLVASEVTTASWAIVAASLELRAISLIDAVSCSVPADAEWTSPSICLAAPLTISAWLVAARAEEAIRSLPAVSRPEASMRAAALSEIDWIASRSWLVSWTKARVSSPISPGRVVSSPSAACRSPAATCTTAPLRVRSGVTMELVSRTGSTIAVTTRMTRTTQRIPSSARSRSTPSAPMSANDS